MREVGGSANFGIDRLLVGPVGGGAKAIFKIIGGPTWPLQPNPLDFTPMLHVPIRFDTSP